MSVDLEALQWKHRHDGWLADPQMEALIAEVRELRARVAELERHLDVMMGTHGEACVHYPCGALEAARKARTP